MCDYYYDEFCTNDKCPYCADFCPVTEHPEMCKYAKVGDTTMPNDMKDRLIDEPNYCDYCCNFDKEHVGMDGMAVCKLTNKIVYSEDGGECPFFNVLKERIIVLPCKVGDTVYSLWSVPTETKYIVYCAEVKKISQYKKNCRLTSVFEIEPIEFRGRRKEYLFDDFGKTVFLTREEAEQALKERSNNESKNN